MSYYVTSFRIAAIISLTAAASIGTASTAELGATPSADTSMLEFVPDQIIIGFETVPAARQLDALTTKFSSINQLRTLNHAQHPKNDPTSVHPLAKVRVAQLDAGSDVLALSEQLSGQAGIRYAHPNYITHTAFIPNDPFWNTHQYGPQIVEAPEAWDTTIGSPSIVIAVADTGINFVHEDFQDGMIWTNPGEIPDNGVDDDNNGYIDDVHGWDCYGDDNDPTDHHSHGSHVSGILAARINNSIGIAGMAQVTVIPLQVFSAGGGGTWEAITEAVYYATDNGAAALNYSGGGGGGDGSLSDACQYAWDNGMTVVAAAGNWNSSSPFYPAAYSPVIAVSGTDSNDNRYTSSNYGDWIDVAAPGVDVYSCGDNGTSDYMDKTGTSMSSPHVCGLVGLMYTLDPGLTPQEVRDLLRDNADDLGAPGFDIYFGYGRINAANTIAAMSSGCPADLTGDDVVDINDVFAVLGYWGDCADPCPPYCTADLTEDCTVDVDDIFAVLGLWGPCE